MVDILIPIFFAKILKNTSRIKKNKRSIKDVLNVFLLVQWTFASS